MMGKGRQIKAKKKVKVGIKEGKSGGRKDKWNMRR